MKIAIDFDGTIVEDRYPKIGRAMPFAFETMKALQQEGHDLVLWTYRSGESLAEALAFCEAQGIVFYAVNESYPNERLEKGESRKINADVFIDDRNVGGFVGWSRVWQILGGSELEYAKEDKPWYQKFFS
ncbi:MAG: hydrolase [Cytophagales bacterium]|nr:hydrolase [Cytophagales bacterium]